MNKDERYINLCLSLAKNGLGKTAPNPMVGAVLIHNNEIIGQGYTSPYGGAHAEVNCLNSVEKSNLELIPKSTLYVSLEPCPHHGKTPPCTDLIIESGIKEVKVATVDINPIVKGKGITKLKDAGINVITGILEKKAVELNKRFFKFHTAKRPYIILKWAQTEDGFMDIDRSNNPETNNWITSEDSKILSHQWRREEQAVMVGTNTAINDNPRLNVRYGEEIHPLRIVLDLNLRLPNQLNLFDRSVPTLVLNSQKEEKGQNLNYVKVNKGSDLVNEITKRLHDLEVQSVIIEGGKQLLSTFIEEGVWDESRVFTSNKRFNSGLKAPTLGKDSRQHLLYGNDELNIYFNA